jgi:hypothetical protein
VDKPDLTDYEIALAGLTENANAIRRAIVPEEDWALVANHLRLVEGDLAEKRREIEKEASEIAQRSREANPSAPKLVLESDRGKLVERTKRSYSYNSSGIMGKALEVFDHIGQAVLELQSLNALELKWKISGLENFGDRYGVEIRRAPREIEDGDPEYLVGVVTTSRMERA